MKKIILLILGLVILLLGYSCKKDFETTNTNKETTENIELSLPEIDVVKESGINFSTTDYFEFKKNYVKDKDSIPAEIRREYTEYDIKEAYIHWLRVKEYLKE